MATANQLRNVGLREAWIAGTEANVDAYLRRQIAAINRSLNAGSVRGYKKRELNKTLKTLEKEFRENFQRFTVEAGASAQKLALLDVETEAALVSEASGIASKVPSEKRIAAATSAIVFTDFAKGSTLTSEQLLRMLDESGAAAVGAMIRAGYTEGLSNDEIAKAIVGTRVTPKGKTPYYAGGLISGAHKRDVMATVRTITQAMSNEARREVWKENSDVIEKLEFVATLDNRTTIICASYDGTQWHLNDANAPQPPLHWNCRSALVPVVSGAGKDPLDYRVAKTGKKGVDEEKIASDRTGAKKRRTERAEVPAGTSFDDFLRGNYKGGQPQPNWYLEDLFGKERAALYSSNSKLSVRNLLKSNNQQFSIEELRHKYGRAVK